jgi:hypothetical protein
VADGLDAFPHSDRCEDIVPARVRAGPFPCYGHLLTLAGMSSRAAFRTVAARHSDDQRGNVS